MTRDNWVKPDLYQLGPFDYWNAIQLENKTSQVKIAEAIAASELGAMLGNACVAVVGSDGKRERHAQSHTEFIIITGKGGDSLRQPLASVLASIGQIDVETAPDGLPAEYLYDGPVPLSYVDGKPQAIYPDFLLTSRMLAGNIDVYLQARSRVLAEMCDLTSAPKITERMRAQLHGYKLAAKTGIYSGAVVFDVEHRTQIYNEGDHKALGFKIPFLRSVQRSLDLITQTHLLNNPGEIREIAATLPRNTVDRIDFWNSKGYFRNASPNFVAEAYSWFLQRYHSAQHSFKINHELSHSTFDAHEFSYYSEIINAYLNRQAAN